MRQCIRQKKRGKGNYQIFNNQIYQGMLKRLTLENDLLKAFKQNEFINYYQPIINIQTQKLEGFEALVRWEHHDKGLILPKEFIPSLETSGLIIPLGIEVLQQACQQLKLWHQQGFPELTISVNLSVRQFASSTLIVDIDRVLVETGINPIYLQLEITESAIMDNPTKAINLIKQLKSRGIKISIDDFGTGYSSLAYLQDFSLDNLKIDSTFIHDIESKNNANKIVETIIYLSNQLDVSLTAEGIETNKQLEFLTQLNCEFGQGYLFCEPLPPSKIDLFIFDSILI